MKMIDLALYLFFEPGSAGFRACRDVDDQKVSAFCQIQGECRGVRCHLTLANQSTV
jgi:hypothetical protein